MKKNESQKFSNTFAKNLKEIMRNRNLSLMKVAELAGCPKSTIQNWLKGSSPTDLKTVNLLAKNLGVSFKFLLLGEMESEKPLSLEEVFTKQLLYEGLCEVTIKKLVPVNTMTLTDKQIELIKLNKVDDKK
jgi:transcriptional regulator with XRE-family HTH domain